MNDNLIAMFTKYKKLMEILHEPYKVKAANNALVKMALVDFIVSPATLPRLKTLLTTGMYNRAVELITTGTVAEIDELEQSDIVRAHQVLGSIIGVGETTIDKWIEQGIYSIVDLRKAVSQRIITLNTMQTWGLRFHADLILPIPREECRVLGNMVLQVLVQVDPHATCEIAGSYRRGKAESGDIDILISSREYFNDALLPNIINILQQDLRFVTVILQGYTRTSFLYKSLLSDKVRQIDLLNIKWESYWTALLYFTGNWEFNEAMRSYAKSRGYKLNQDGLYLGNKIIQVNSEQDIFTALRLQWVNPNDRTGANKIIPI